MEYCEPHSHVSFLSPIVWADPFIVTDAICELEALIKLQSSCCSLLPGKVQPYPFLCGYTSS